MTQKSELGQFGENLACEYLIDNGYKIIERNFRQKWGEIDIIAKAPDKTLVFVEVKTLRDYSLRRGSGQAAQAPEKQLQPEDQLTSAKLQKLQKTASLYSGHYPEKVSDEKGWRIDLVALRLGSSTELSRMSSGQGEETEIKHYENI